MVTRRRETVKSRRYLHDDEDVRETRHGMGAPTRSLEAARLHVTISCLERQAASSKLKRTSRHLLSVNFIRREPRNLQQTTPGDLDNMSWRNQGITGSNNIPLGTRRRFGGDDADGDDGGYNPAAPATGLSELKRGRSPTRGTSSSFYDLLPVLTSRAEADGTRRRRKRNRWGDASENKAAGLMGLPTAIYAAMTTEQLDAYTLHLRIEEITQKLKINDVVPPDGDRYVRLQAFPLR